MYYTFRIIKFLQYDSSVSLTFIIKFGVFNIYNKLVTSNYSTDCESDATLILLFLKEISATLFLKAEKGFG